MFGVYRSLIRGPSDTGKSHIRECLYYLLGGEKPVKPPPEGEGYDTLRLEFEHDGIIYAITKAFAGGTAQITKNFGSDKSEALAGDLGEFLVSLAGAHGKQIIRSRSSKGPVTGGDLRHWFLISQTEVISDQPTTGPPSNVDRIQRAAAFYVFLTGMDDAAVVLAKTKAQRDSISGQIFAAENAIQRANAGLPPALKKEEVIDSLERVDEALGEITRQYEARATQLRSIRQEITEVAEELKERERARAQSQAMVHRFSMLDRKYQSDLDRLDATGEGIAYFDALRTVPCPLCGTPAEQHVSPTDLRPSAPANYRAAIHAEAQKIRQLRVGLNQSLNHELQRVQQNAALVTDLRNSLDHLEQRERHAITGLRVEFSHDPKELALRRSELSSQMNLFEDIERLQAEIERLKKVKSTKPTSISRAAIAPAKEVAAIAESLLHGWGFADVERVELDMEACDLVINGRARLSYGAGRRAVARAALAVAMLKNSLERGRPHIGFVVIDSPIKAYADPKAREADDVAPSTVRDKFFSWLSRWSGPGQVVILENEEVVNAEVAAELQVIEFTGPNRAGRPGFYPASIRSLRAGSEDNSG